MAYIYTVGVDLKATGLTPGLAVYNLDRSLFLARTTVGLAAVGASTFYTGTFTGVLGTTYFYVMDDGLGHGVWGVVNPGVNANLVSILPSADHDGTFQAGSTTTALKLDASDGIANGLPNATSNQAVRIVRGTGEGQLIPIASLSGTTPNRLAIPAVSFTVNPAPDATSDYSWEASPAGGVSVPTAAQVATAVWQDATSGDFTVVGSPGKLLIAQLAGAFAGTSSVLTTASLVNAATTVVLAMATSPVGSVAAPVTTGTVSDKTGYSLSSTGLDAAKGWGTWSARQTIQAIAQFLFGVRSNVPAFGVAGTVTYTGPSSAVYGTVSVDTSGNIITTALTPPS